MTEINGAVPSLAERSPRVGLLVEHGELRQLCLALEVVADDLPRLPPADAVRRLCDELHTLAEVRLPRVLKAMTGEVARYGADARLEAIVKDLCAMHALDALHAQDVAARLRSLRGRRSTDRAEEIGYMLRCLFEGLRRSMLVREALLWALSTNATERPA